MRTLVLAFSLLACGCGAPDETSAGTQPAEREPVTETTEMPAAAEAEAEAMARPREDMLAARLTLAAGPIEGVAELRFTFVVTVDGEERVRREHVWCPEQSSVRVTAGETTTRVATSGEPGDAQREAYEQFINDSYWLLVPTKLFDPGVHRAIEGDDLRLTFAEVGVTPGDTYWLETEGDHIVGWRFRLESGREGSFAFEDRTTVGPLTLSLTKRSRDGDAVIAFEDVGVGEHCSL